MNDQKHITDLELFQFHNNLLNQNEKETFLEHICSCNYCSDLFTASLSEEIIPAPRDMKANILKATKRPEVQLAIRAKETSKQMQLFFYSLKVGTATILALLLLILTINFGDPSNISNINQPNVTDHSMIDKDNVPFATVIRNNMDSLSSSILNFSNNIMKTEVTKND